MMNTPLRYATPLALAVLAVTLLTGCLAIYGRVRIPAYPAGSIPSTMAATLRGGEYGSGIPGVHVLSINGRPTDELVRTAEEYQGYHFNSLALREYALMPGQNHITVQFDYNVKVITGSDGKRIYYRKEKRYSTRADLQFEAKPGTQYVVEGDRKAFTGLRDEPFTFTLCEMNDDGTKKGTVATATAELKK